MTFEALTSSLLLFAQSQGSVFLRKLRPPRTPYTLGNTVMRQNVGITSNNDTETMTEQNVGTGKKQNETTPPSGEGQTWLETWCTSVLQIGVSRQLQSEDEDIPWTMTDCVAKIAEYEMEKREMVRSQSSRSIEESRKRSRSDQR